MGTRTDTQHVHVLVTGASGVVGSAVARAARRQGYRVRVLARPTSQRTNVADLDAEIATGDMRDEASMRAALRGVRHLLLVAAAYRLSATDPPELERAHLEGAVATALGAPADGVAAIGHETSVAPQTGTPPGTT
ncbi:NAD-dependent epimerase/dehydratase family protein, partial [Burkholderia pseudomallei]|uniref:NAD-dependent epimerase/dehydratase family protein n=1 Tax=Burkholderia pseudomallei TaxID=28450 RepID=UPI0011AF68FA